MKLSKTSERNPILVEMIPTPGISSETETESTDSHFQEPTGESSLIIFHSSGSSGLPKPIYHIHRFWSYSLATAAGTEIPAYTTTPLYHGGMSDFFRSLQAGSSIFFHPIAGQGDTLSPEAITTAFAVSSQHADVVLSKPRYFLSVPFILEMLSKSSIGMDFLQSMSLVSTGGAPLPQAVGDFLVENNVPIVSRLGSSECGFLMSSFRDFQQDKDWNWLRVQQDWNGKRLLDFRQNPDNPGLFELVVTGDWPTKLLSNGPNGCFATEDLYARHDVHPDRYQYATRVDDTLVLVNGKKFAAGLIENRLRQSKLVDDAIVFGSNRALVGAIILPAEVIEGEADKYAFVQKLRPLLSDHLNPGLPAHARIIPELLVISDTNLSAEIPRSSKGTLQRGQAYRKFENLFDTLYLNYEEGRLPGYPEKQEFRDGDLVDCLLRLVNQVLPVPVKSENDDFHLAGMDSISATRLKAMVNQYVEIGGQRLGGNVIYDCPTVASLAQHINSLRNSQAGTTQDLSTNQAAMRSIVEQQSALLPGFQKQFGDRSGPRTVLLTGVTGALGAELLCALLAAAGDVVVICLVRAENHDLATIRVQDSLAGRKLNHLVTEDAWRSRIRCFASRLIDDGCLGIQGQEFSTLVAKSGRLEIIHAAWSVNFALSLRSFEADNIASLGNLLRFALKNGVTSFLFCSSIASVLGNSDDGSQNVPEEPSLDPSSAGPLGYSQSKWVGEALMSAASQKGLKTTVARIGQLCANTSTGVWNESEAWPLMIRTAKEIGALPVLGDGQKIDWLPVDIAADAIVQLLDARPSSATVATTSIFHVFLPCDKLGHETIPQWRELLDWLAAADLNFERKSLQGWLAAVQANIGNVRGRALLDIWRGLPGDDAKLPSSEKLMPIVETSKARHASVALRNAKPITDRLIANTVEHWRQIDFL